MERGNVENSHAIRLNSAWEIRWLTEDPPQDCDLRELFRRGKSAVRVNLPSTGIAAPQACVATLATRRFNRPSNVTSLQAIHLHLKHLPADTRIYFNGALVEALRPEGAEIASLPITALLQDNNRLDLMLPDAGFLGVGDVRLIITDAGS